MPDERRASPRLPAHLAGELESAEGKSTIAITRDVGAGGLSVFTRLRLTAGTAVKLTVVFNDQQLKIGGTVIREQPLDPEQSTLWRSKVAIAVDAGDPVLAQIYAELAKS